MDEIKFKLSDQGRGSFYVQEGDETLADMEISIMKENLIVYHTEVSEKLRGTGMASKILTKMVDHARSKNLKVVPLCPYVLAQFKRHPELYNDIWNKNWHP